MHDDHGQPVPRSFNFRRNEDKAVDTMLGFLRGLVSDKHLNETEILFLDSWLRDNEFLRDDPDVIDILDAVGDVLADGVVTVEEAADLEDLIRTVFKYRYVDPLNVDDAINQLLGLVTGVLADGVVTAAEINVLSRWIDSTEELDDVWPAAQIRARIRDVVSSGTISDEEREDVRQTLELLVGNPVESGSVRGISSRLGCDDSAAVEFAGRVFCFTGRFAYGTRSACQEAVVARGGVIADKVTREIDYLVIGLTASRDWRFETYGRKIEKAITYREQGNRLAIISEETWASCL